mmetsp:Transcript_28379/g.74538  ORF Transcript_28379/g.74538 Transcript_28379/m.74538 type:complete len:213 (+) Transcript_28379:645-1283(+)
MVTRPSAHACSSSYTWMVAPSGIRSPRWHVRRYGCGPQCLRMRRPALRRMNEAFPGIPLCASPGGAPMRERCCSMAHVRGVNLQCASLQCPPLESVFSAAYRINSCQHWCGPVFCSSHSSRALGRNPCSSRSRVNLSLPCTSTNEPSGLRIFLSSSATTAASRSIRAGSSSSGTSLVQNGLVTTLTGSAPTLRSTSGMSGYFQCEPIVSADA